MLTFPKLNVLPTNEISIDSFNGIDKSSAAEKNSVFEAYNISSEAMPRLKTRSGRKKIFSLSDGTSFKRLFSFDRAYFTAAYNGGMRLFRSRTFDTIVLVYTSKENELLSDVLCKFDDCLCIFNIKKLDGKHFEALMLYDNDTGEKARVKLPYFEDAITYKNRIFACADRKVYACAYNDATNWDTEELRTDIQNRAVTLTESSKAAFVTCTVHKNTALFFTSRELYRLKGSDAESFALEKVDDFGCISKNSLCSCNGALYFMSQKGLAKYGSGKVEFIDFPLSLNASDVKSAVLCAGKKTVYVLVETEHGKEMYTYNTQNGGFACEESINAVGATSYLGNPYFMDESTIYEFEVPYSLANEKNELNWQVETQKFCCNLSRSRGSKINLGICVEKGGLAEVLIDVDDSGWQVISTILEGEKDVCIPLPISDFKSIRIRIKGVGQGEISFIKLEYYKGAEGR